MRFAVAVGLLGLAVGLPLTSASAESIDVGGWKVERSGAEPANMVCTVLSVSDDKKGGFIMGVTASGLAFVGLVDTDLKLTSGANFQASYHVDGNAPSKIVGQAASETTYMLPLGDWKETQGVFQTASAGNSVYIEVGGSSYEYSLAGSKDALASFGKCAESIGLAAAQ